MVAVTLLAAPSAAQAWEFQDFGQSFGLQTSSPMEFGMEGRSMAGSLVVQILCEPDPEDPAWRQMNVNMTFEAENRMHLWRFGKGIPHLTFNVFGVPQAHISDSTFRTSVEERLALDVEPSDIVMHKVGSPLDNWTTLSSTTLPQDFADTSDAASWYASQTVRWEQIISSILSAEDRLFFSFYDGQANEAFAVFTIDSAGANQAARSFWDACRGGALYTPSR